MAVLALRILLAPCFVVAVSLLAHRFGVRIGGTVAGLPVIAGPILLVLALEHGTPFARRAAIGVMLGIVGLAAFVLFAYASFCFVVALAVRSLGIAACFALATGVTLVVQAAAVAVTHRRAGHRHTVIALGDDRGASDYA